MSNTVPPRPHGCLWEIMAVILGLIIGIILIAAIIAGVAYFFGWL